MMVKENPIEKTQINYNFYGQINYKNFKNTRAKNLVISSVV
jgi:hypothetical protein